MFRLVHVHDHERGLWFRRGEFQDLILPGSTWLLSWQDKIQIVDTLSPRFDHPLLDLLIEKPHVREQLDIVDLDSMQCAFVWKDGRLLDILGPGRHAFWKTSADLHFEIFSIGMSVRFEHSHMEMPKSDLSDTAFVMGPGERSKQLRSLVGNKG